MRVCIVLDQQPSHFPNGGVEKATHALCKGLLRAGHDLTLIAAGRSGGDSWVGVPTVRVAQSGRRMLVGGADAWNEGVIRTLDEVQPALAQGQGLAFAGNAVVNWSHGRRVVVVHGSTLEDLRYEYSWAGRALRAPFVRAAGVKAVQGADAVVNVTIDWRVNCPVAPLNAFYIPNPVDDDFFATTAAPEPGEVAFFGGLKRIKGIDLLLNAWPRVLRELPWATLHLYGIAPEEKVTLPPRCRAHAILHSSSETATAMGRASAVVVPSRYEVSPLVAAEAMAVGVPLVATDVGGVRAMTEGVASLCRVDAGDIAASIVSALRDPLAWEATIIEGRRRSAAFGIEMVAAAYASLYERLV